MTPPQRRALARAFRALERAANEGALLTGEMSTAAARIRAEAIATAARVIVDALDDAAPAAALLDQIAHAQAQQAAPNVVSLRSRRHKRG